jgi:hypothetical protein
MTKEVMQLIDEDTGELNCKVCGAVHFPGRRLDCERQGLWELCSPHCQDEPGKTGWAFLFVCLIVASDFF